MTAAQLIRTLQLIPHPEGGYFRQLYGNEPNQEKEKSVSTIYYLLENEQFSAFHRLSNIEIWYFHAGEPIFLYVIDEWGELIIHTLSLEGECQVVIYPNQWFAADIPSKKGFTLVGCAVVPAFTFDHFELADSQQLIQKFPQHQSLIMRLTI
ncbi:MAG: cupin domain-containing protein [Bacteroidales bacterium]